VRKIVGVVVEVECPHCGGRCRVPGGQREYGETVPCPLCRARGTLRESCTLLELRDLLMRAD